MKAVSPTVIYHSQKVERKNKIVKTSKGEIE